MAFRLPADWIGPWKPRYAHTHIHTAISGEGTQNSRGAWKGGAGQCSRAMVAPLDSKAYIRRISVCRMVEPGSVPEPLSVQSISILGISKKGEGHCSGDFAQLESHGVPECCCTGSPFQICPLRGLGIRPGSSLQKGAQHMPVTFCEAKAQFQTSQEAVPWRAHWLDGKMKLHPGRVPGKNAD